MSESSASGVGGASGRATSGVLDTARCWVPDGAGLAAATPAVNATNALTEVPAAIQRLRFMRPARFGTGELIDGPAKW